MNLDEWLGSSQDEFEHGEMFVRQRAGGVEDPYSGRLMNEDWSNPDELPLEGAFLSSSSSAEINDPVRRQTDSRAILTIPDPAADVRKGDRIKQGHRVWTVNGFPAQDRNPWTGWQPTLAVSLEEFVG